MGIPQPCLGDSVPFLQEHILIGTQEIPGHASGQIKTRRHHLFQFHHRSHPPQCIQKLPWFTKYEQSPQTIPSESCPGHNILASVLSALGHDTNSIHESEQKRDSEKNMGMFLTLRGSPVPWPCLKHLCKDLYPGHKPPHATQLPPLLFSLKPRASILPFACQMCALR